MGHALDELSVSELTALANSLEGGRISFPPTRFEIQRLGISTKIAQILVEAMLPWKDASSAARIINAYSQGKQSVSSLQKTLQLVWSGPDCPGTFHRDTKVVIDDLFKSATTEVLVAGFAIFNGKAVFHELAKRMDVLPDLKVKLFLNVHYHPDLSEAETVRQFGQNFREHHWPGNRLPTLYYDPRSLCRDKHQRAVLHAKCILCDRKAAFITSANFTEAAQTRNIEVGTILFSTALATELAEVFEALVRSHQLLELPI